MVSAAHWLRSNSFEDFFFISLHKPFGAFYPSAFSKPLLRPQVHLQAQEKKACLFLSPPSNQELRYTCDVSKQLFVFATAGNIGKLQPYIMKLTEFYEAAAVSGCFAERHTEVEASGVRTPISFNAPSFNTFLFVKESLYFYFTTLFILSSSFSGLF